MFEKMKKIGIFILAVILLGSCMETKNNVLGGVFENEYQTPHNTIPFDKIKTDDYLPAMRRGMQLHNEEVNAITENAEAPTFENTVEAFERSGQALSRPQYAFYNLLSAETSDVMDSIANEIAPEETEHSNNIYLNEKLYERVLAVYKQKDSLKLTVEQQTLLQNTYDAFVKRARPI